MIMKRLLTLTLTCMLSAAIFHFISRSFSYISVNWILENAEWPDQRSYFWTLKLGYCLSIVYFFPIFLSALVLLRQKYFILPTNLAFAVYVSTSSVLAFIAGWVLAVDFDFDANQLNFVLLLLSPLWLFLIHALILKLVLRAYS